MEEKGRPVKIRNYICDVCNYNFTRSNDLKRHKESVHEPEIKNFKCDKCGVGFKRSDALKRHYSSNKHLG